MCSTSRSTCATSRRRQISAKDGSPLPKNPLSRHPRCARRSISRSTARRWPRSPWKASASRSNQLVTPIIFGYNKSLPEREVRSRRGQEAAGRGRLSERLQGRRLSFTQDRLPGDRQVGTSIAQMLARDRHRRAGQRAAGGRVLPGAHARRVLDVDVGLGHADRRGALHALLARATPTTRTRSSARSTCSATRTPRWTS